jgi:spore coat polysaccharide biosynthesis protein SpsF
LPGKVLLPMLGRPMLAHLLDRLRTIDALAGIVVATSLLPSDNPVAEFARAERVDVWRGALDDVLGRVAGAAAANRASAVVRISGDSPLLDPRIVRHAIELFGKVPADLVTNVFPRSFPRGQSVEVLSREALDRVAGEAIADEDREHVTRFLYAHPDRFTIVNFRHQPPRPELQLSVDSREDFYRAEELLRATGHVAPFPTVDRLIAEANAMENVKP